MANLQHMGLYDPSRTVGHSMDNSGLVTMAQINQSNMGMGGMSFHNLTIPPQAPPPPPATPTPSTASSTAASKEKNNHQARQSDWSHHVRPNPTPPFHGPPAGPAVICPPGTPELTYFNMLFPESLMELLTVETNRYAQQNLQDKANARWTPCGLNEMKAYIGLRIYMSILNLPHQEMYWSGDWLFGNLATPQIMARNRFQMISRNFSANDLTLNPPDTEPDHDKLHELRPVLNVVLRALKENYHPNQNMCLDETAIPCKSRLGWKQKSSDGSSEEIKLWMRADSVSGYVNDFQVYTGKSSVGKGEGSIATRVMVDMTKDLQNTNAIMNTKGFFTNPKLFERLYDLGILCRGTVKADYKEFPEAQLGSKAFNQHGQSAAVQKGHVCAYAWKDKGVVQVLSTADDPTVMETVKRKQRDGWVKPVACPQAIARCNKYLNGVSHANQLRQEYPTSRTSSKWWHYVFWFIIDTCMANSYIIMKETSMHHNPAAAKKMCVLDFKKNLSKQLVGGQIKNPGGNKRTSSSGDSSSPSKKRGRKMKKAKSKKNKKKELKTKSRVKRSKGTSKMAKLAEAAAMFYPMEPIQGMPAGIQAGIEKAFIADQERQSETAAIHSSVTTAQDVPTTSQNIPTTSQGVHATTPVIPATSHISTTAHGVFLNTVSIQGVPTTSLPTTHQGLPHANHGVPPTTNHGAPFTSHGLPPTTNQGVLPPVTTHGETHIQQQQPMQEMPPHSQHQPHQQQLQNQWATALAYWPVRF